MTVHITYIIYVNVDVSVDLSIDANENDLVRVVAFLALFN